jgi:hypothetical protein
VDIREKRTRVEKQQSDFWEPLEALFLAKSEKVLAKFEIVNEIRRKQHTLPHTPCALFMNDTPPISPRSCVFSRARRENISWLTC